MREEICEIYLVLQIKLLQQISRIDAEFEALTFKATPIEATSNNTRRKHTL